MHDKDDHGTGIGRKMRRNKGRSDRTGRSGGEVKMNNESDDARQQFDKREPDGEGGTWTHFDRRELHGHRLREGIKH